MSKYDDASWHFGGDYPNDLPIENASTHISMFLAWCINNHLICDEILKDEEDGIYIQKVKEGKLTGSEFLSIFDDKFTDDMLNDIGNAFTLDYYESDTEFGKKFSEYLIDYCDALDKSDYETIYSIENTYENYEVIAKIIDERFKQWKEYKKL